MFLQIGNTFFNQEKIEYIKIYATHEEQLKSPSIEERVRHCLPKETCLVQKYYYKFTIIVKAEETYEYVIHNLSGFDLDTVTDNMEKMRERLFSLLGIHNIKIDLDTGEIAC